MRLALLIGSLAVSAQAVCAEIPLYPTGPAQDSAYLRLINVSASPLELAPEGSKATLKLAGDKVATDFIAVPGGKTAKGTLSRDGHHVPLAVTVAPGDFATVFALPAADGGIQQQVVTEPFDLPNQLKASVALFNADARCTDPRVNVAGKDLDLFQKAPAGSPRRQELNPRAQLAVQLVCAGANVGPAVELGPLEANKRYSLLLVPAPAGPQLVAVTDSVAN
ncbi:cell division protein FtsQ [Pseudomonas sp. TE3610]